MTPDGHQIAMGMLERQRNDALAAIANLELRIEMLLREANIRVAELQEELKLIAAGLV